MVNLSKRKQRILEIFNSPNAKLNEDETKFASELIDRYQRQDVVLYVLRQYKLAKLFEKVQVNYELTKSEKSFMSRMMGRQLDALSPSKQATGIKFISSFKNFISQFQHYYELDIPLINNTELLFQSPVTLFEHYNELEQKWINKQRRVIDVNLDDEEEVSEIIFEQDGLFVFDTHTYCCDKEAAAMGHCGNKLGNSSQRLLSVRSKVDADGMKWKPHATIILNECQFDLDGNITSSRTGEIKGFANEPVSKKYHSFIADFILSANFINGMDGGGYNPKNNLQFTDFTDEQQEDLIEKDECFLGIIDRLLLAKGNIDENLISDFKELLDVDDVVEIGSFDNLEDLSNQLGVDNLHSFLSEDQFPIDAFESTLSEEQNLLNSVFLTNVDIKDRLVEWALRSGISESYSLDSSGISEWSYDNQNILHESLSKAVCLGNMDGTKEELSRQIQNMLSKQNALSAFTINASNYYSGEATITATPEECLKKVYEIIIQDCSMSNFWENPIGIAQQESDLFNSLSGSRLCSGVFEDALFTEYRDYEEIIDLPDLDDMCHMSDDVAINSFINDISQNKAFQSTKRDTSPSFIDVYKEEVASSNSDVCKSEDTLKNIQKSCSLKHKY